MSLQYVHEDKNAERVCTQRFKFDKGRTILLSQPAASPTKCNILLSEDEGRLDRSSTDSFPYLMAIDKRQPAK